MIYKLGFDSSMLSNNKKYAIPNNFETDCKLEIGDIISLSKDSYSEYYNRINELTKLVGLLKIKEKYHVIEGKKMVIILILEEHLV